MNFPPSRPLATEFESSIPNPNEMKKFAAVKSQLAQDRDNWRPIWERPLQCGRRRHAVGDEIVTNEYLNDMCYMYVYCELRGTVRNAAPFNIYSGGTCLSSRMPSQLFVAVQTL